MSDREPRLLTGCHCPHNTLFSGCHRTWFRIRIYSRIIIIILHSLLCTESLLFFIPYCVYVIGLPITICISTICVTESQLFFIPYCVYVIGLPTTICISTTCVTEGDVLTHLIHIVLRVFNHQLVSTKRALLIGIPVKKAIARLPLVGIEEWALMNSVIRDLQPYLLILRETVVRTHRVLAIRRQDLSFSMTLYLRGKEA